jgi:hypothetical protein
MTEEEQARLYNESMIGTTNNLQGYNYSVLSKIQEPSPSYHIMKHCSPSLHHP